MGVIKGGKEYKKFKDGGKLTRKQAMLAMCYDCNGAEESREDCLGTDCPLYDYRPYKG
jgi:hypothetical protein